MAASTTPNLGAPRWNHVWAYTYSIPYTNINTYYLYVLDDAINSSWQSLKSSSTTIPKDWEYRWVFRIRTQMRGWWHVASSKIPERRQAEEVQPNAPPVHVTWFATMKIRLSWAECSELWAEGLSIQTNTKTARQRDQYTIYFFKIPYMQNVWGNVCC